MHVTISVQSAPVQALLQRLADSGRNMQPVMMAIANELYDRTLTRFGTQSDPAGATCAPASPAPPAPAQPLSPATSPTQPSTSLAAPFAPAAKTRPRPLSKCRRVPTCPCNRRRRAASSTLPRRSTSWRFIPACAGNTAARSCCQNARACRAAACRYERAGEVSAQLRTTPRRTIIPTLRDHGETMNIIRIAAISAVLAAAGCATTPAGPPIVVAGAYPAPGVTKSDVCGRARDWAARTFSDSKAVVEVYDQERGKMIGKGNMMVPGPLGVDQRVAFTLDATCADGELRARMDGFYILPDPRYSVSPIPAHQTPDSALYESIKRSAAALLAGLGDSVRVR